MPSDDRADDSSKSEDLEDIEIVKNLLELRSCLKAKTHSIENEAD